jgi:hypothetical protein
MRSIAWPSNDPLYPWGIVWVRPGADYLTIRIEGERTAAEFARVLPPRIGEDGELRGIPGARLSPASKNGVTVSILGSAGSVRITGVAPHRWREIQRVVEGEAREEGAVSCQGVSPWRWTAQEISDGQYLGALSVRRSSRAVSTAWLASGLLRRVGLWRALGVPLSTTSWTNPMPQGEQWIVEHFHHSPQLSDRHDAFVRLLTVPGWGLGATPQDVWCNCAQGGGMCQVTVAAVGRAGELQLRFPRRPDPCTWQRFDPDEHLVRETLPVTVRPWMLKETGAGSGPLGMNHFGAA